MRDERPRHRLHEAARGQRPLGEARALLQGRQRRLGDGGIATGQRLRLDPVEAGDADDLLHEIGLAFHIRAPGRGENLHSVARAGHVEPEGLQRHLHLGAGEFDPGKAARLGPGEIDDTFRLGQVTGDHRLARRAAADLDDHAGGEVEPRQGENGSTPRSNR